MSESKRDQVISKPMQTCYTLKEVIPTILFSNVTLTIAFVVATYHEKFGMHVPNLPSQSDRLIYTLKLQILPASTLLVSMFHVMSGRLGNPEARNPLSGHEFYVEVANRILANTLEQLVLFVINILAFSVLASPDHLFVVPFLVFTFTVGRIAFLVGYVKHPKHRVFGFVWTFVPTVLLFGFNVFKIFGL